MMPQDTVISLSELTELVERQRQQIAKLELEVQLREEQEAMRRIEAERLKSDRGPEIEELATRKRLEELQREIAAIEQKQKAYEEEQVLKAQSSADAQQKGAQQAEEVEKHEERSRKVQRDEGVLESLQNYGKALNPEATPKEQMGGFDAVAVMGSVALGLGLTLARKLMGLEQGGAQGAENHDPSQQIAENERIREEQRRLQEEQERARQQQQQGQKR